MSTEHPPIEFELGSPETKRDPYPLLHRLRQEDPIHFVEKMGVWLASRYQDIFDLYNDERVTGDRRVWEFYVQPKEGTFNRWVDDYGLMALDRKKHAQQRKLLASGFTPRGIERMERQIREVVERFARPLHGRRDVVEIMSEFTTPIPNAVISAITGVSATGVSDEEFSRLAQETIQGFFGFVSEEIQDRAEASYQILSKWVRQTVDLRRDEPQEDLISDIMQARVGAYTMTDEDIVAQVSALLAAGSETTANGGMLAVMTLLDHPESLERVRADRALIPQTVNEILRYAFAGLAGTMRFAVEDFELHGKQIKKGQAIILSGGGASHDPEKYPDPETFDIDRDPKDLLTFGIGPHYCLGANLAKGELCAMVDAALDFLPPGARVLKEQMAVESLGVFDRIKTCPIDFGAGERG